MKKEHTLKERLQKPTPRFFRKIRKWSALLGAIGVALAAPPLGVPLVSAILITAGTVGATVATAVTEEE